MEKICAGTATRTCHKKGGFTLVETVVAVAIFTIIFLAVYESYTKIFELIALGRTRAVAMALVNEKIEIARNLPFADVGTVTGIPRGKIPASVNEVRSNMEFEVTTVVRNIDDPFDGLIGGVPNDTSPADYKLVDVSVACALCKNFSPLSVTTFVAPKNLEISSSTNGALFVNIIDGSGQPVSGASIHIENQSTTPPIIIDDVSGVGGSLQLVDIPPGIEAYQVSVTKDNYTSDGTLSRTVSNPDPTTPHATIAQETVTSLTLSIDRVSSIRFSSKTETCTPVPNIDFHLAGHRLIGSPDILKYEEDLVTDGTGMKYIPSMEWDTYNLDITDSVYQLIGTNALSPVQLLPGEAKEVDLIVAGDDPNTLLVTVRDGASKLPVSNASVRVVGGSTDTTYQTGRGFLRQTDWSGGGGQATSTDVTRYESSDGNVAVSSPVGEIKLRETFGFFSATGELISSSFDMGSVSNFHELTWGPTSQPPDVGADSVRLQLATNADGGTWDYLGPDGTSATFYTSGVSAIAPIHNGDRYLRYKILLATASTTYTPNVADVAFTFTSACVPSGQVAFRGLADDSYDLYITKSGYQTMYASTSVSGDWESMVVDLLPE